MTSCFVGHRRNLKARCDEGLADGVVELARYLGALPFLHVYDFGSQLSHPLPGGRESIEHFVDGGRELSQIAVSDDRARDSVREATLGNPLRNTLELLHGAKCQANQGKVDGRTDYQRRHDYIDIDQLEGLEPGRPEKYQYRNTQDYEIGPQELELERDAENREHDAWDARCRHPLCAARPRPGAEFRLDQTEFSTHWTTCRTGRPASLQTCYRSYV